MYYRRYKRIINRERFLSASSRSHFRPYTVSIYMYIYMPFSNVTCICRELHLAAIWNNLTEETVIDNSTNM